MAVASKVESPGACGGPQVSCGMSLDMVVLLYCEDVYVPEAGCMKGCGGGLGAHHRACLLFWLAG